MRRNTAIAAVGVTLGRGLHRSEETLTKNLLLAGIALVIGSWERALRERAYYKWVRNAPASDQNFPVRHNFQENLERMAAVLPLSRFVLNSVLGTLLTLLFLAGSVYRLIDDPLQWTTFITVAATLFVAWATVASIFQWRLKRRMSTDSLDGQEPATEIDRPARSRPNPGNLHGR